MSTFLTRLVAFHNGFPIPAEDFLFLKLLNLQQWLWWTLEFMLGINQRFLLNTANIQEHKLCVNIHKSPDCREMLLACLVTSLGIKVISAAAPKEPPTSPAVTATPPEIMVRVVLFPAPLGPNRPNTSPGTNMQQLLMMFIGNMTFPLCSM